MNSSFIANLQLFLRYLVLYLVQQHLHTTLHQGLAVSCLLSQDTTPFDFPFLVVIEFLRLLILLLLKGFSTLLFLLLYELVFQALRIDHKVHGWFRSWKEKIEDLIWTVYAPGGIFQYGTLVFLLSLELWFILKFAILRSRFIVSTCFLIHLSRT